MWACVADESSQVRESFRLKGAIETIARHHLPGQLIEENPRRERMIGSELKSEMQFAGIGAVIDVA